MKTQMNKRKQILSHKLVVLSMLQLELLDELKPITPKMIKLHKDLTEFCELLIDSLKDTESIQKGVYFQELSNKVDTILRKNFDENM